MNKIAIEQAKDRDMASSIDAIRRAAKRAHQIAAHTGTALIVRHGEQIDRVMVIDQEAFPQGEKLGSGLNRLQFQNV